ncbi:unnamed protein product [Protopolystoma xenopodis]|uniref:Uncharacterized protein n=1 Tax=Protopolystoma xenopodis TaxID=117903 RepID=A0A448XIF4_9PLAT|nr:unnamed protein product [Protopolystoma xenopodis]
MSSNGVLVTWRTWTLEQKTCRRSTSVKFMQASYQLRRLRQAAWLRRWVCELRRLNWRRHFDDARLANAWKQWMTWIMEKRKKRQLLDLANRSYQSLALVPWAPSHLPGSVISLNPCHSRCSVPTLPQSFDIIYPPSSLFGMCTW